MPFLVKPMRKNATKEQPTRWLWNIDLLVCETGFPEPDMVTVVKPDVVEVGA